MLSREKEKYMLTNSDLYISSCIWIPQLEELLSCFN